MEDETVKALFAGFCRVTLGDDWRTDEGDEVPTPSAVILAPTSFVDHRQRLAREGWPHRADRLAERMSKGDWVDASASTKESAGDGRADQCGSVRAEEDVDHRGNEEWQQADREDRELPPTPWLSTEDQRAESLAHTVRRWAGRPKRYRSVRFARTNLEEGVRFNADDPVVSLKEVKNVRSRLIAPVTTSAGQPGVGDVTNPVRVRVQVGSPTRCDPEETETTMTVEGTNNGELTASGDSTSSSKTRAADITRINRSKDTLEQTRSSDDEGIEESKSGTSGTSTEGPRASDRNRIQRPFGNSGLAASTDEDTSHWSEQQTLSSRLRYQGSNPP